MDEILLLLLRLGAHKKPVKMTTAEIGIHTGISQQSASRRLLLLEAGGMIKRVAGGTMLTKKTRDELAKEYAILKAALDSKLEISGKICSGLGEGAYYMGLEGYRRQIKERLGFEPFPGTLNIRLDNEERWKKDQLVASDPIIISGFTDKKRSYGDLYAYSCSLDGHSCAIIIPLRTSHGQDILELICGFDIKKRLRRKDGDLVRVVF